MPRYGVALPIVVAGMTGTTREMGVTGVSFVAPQALPPEEAITFSITLSGERYGLIAECRGTVKRVTPMKDGQFEIVATIDALDLRPSARLP